MWPFTKHQAVKSQVAAPQESFWDKRERDILARAAASPPNRIGIWDAGEERYYYDAETARCVRNGTTSTWPKCVIAILDRDKDVFHKLMTLLDAMLRSKRVKYARIDMAMGGSYHRLETWLDYGQQGPSLNLFHGSVSLDNGPSADITTSEQDAIEQRMKAHAQDPRVEIEEMYDLL